LFSERTKQSFEKSLQPFAKSCSLFPVVSNQQQQQQIKENKVMAHNLESRDVQVGLEMAWHGLTKVVSEIRFEDAFPFEIEKRQLADSEDGSPIEGEYY
jgi:hypothetical protein